MTESFAVTRPNVPARLAFPSALGLMEQVRRVNDAVSSLNDGYAATLVGRIELLASTLADRLDALTWETESCDPRPRAGGDNVGPAG
jgi:hypothetical protein